MPNQSEARHAPAANASTTAAPSHKWPDDDVHAARALLRERERVPKWRQRAGDKRLEPKAEDELLFHVRLHRTLGTSDTELISLILGQLAGAAWNCEPTSAINGAMAVLAAAEPRDPLEGMLAAQAFAAHNAAMECYRRAMLPEQTFEGRRENLNQANRCSRTYVTLLEGLRREQGKAGSEQKVTVEHVHVYQGGQAIVGAVTGGTGGPRAGIEATPCTRRLTTNCCPCTKHPAAARGPAAVMPAARRRW